MRDKLYIYMTNLYGWLTAVYFSVISISVLVFGIAYDFNLWVSVILLSFSLLAFFRIKLQLKGGFTKKDHIWIIIINIATLGLNIIDYFLYMLRYKTVKYKLTITTWLIFFNLLLICGILAIIYMNIIMLYGILPIY